MKRKTKFKVGDRAIVCDGGPDHGLTVRVTALCFRYRDDTGYWRDADELRPLTARERSRKR